jgi:hypothetical protein
MMANAVASNEDRATKNLKILREAAALLAGIDKRSIGKHLRPDVSALQAEAARIAADHDAYVSGYKS